MVESGAAVSICPLGRATLRTATGAQIEHAGQKTVEYENSDGGSVNVSFEVADVTKPLVAVGELQKRGMTVVMGPHGSFVTRGHVTKPLGNNLDLEHSNGAYWLCLTRGENGTSTVTLVDLGDAVPTSENLSDLPTVEDTIDVAREDAEGNVPLVVPAPNISRFQRSRVSISHRPSCGGIVSLNSRQTAASDFVVVWPSRGSSTSAGFTRLCCSKIPSILARHSALCMPIPLEQRNPSCDHARMHHCGSIGNSPGPTAIEVFGLGLNGSPESLSTHSRLHLADSGCRLMVRNLRTPCSSPHKCSSMFFVFPNQTSSANSLRTCHAAALI